MESASPGAWTNRSATAGLYATGAGQVKGFAGKPAHARTAWRRCICYDGVPHGHFRPAGPQRPAERNLRRSSGRRLHLHPGPAHHRPPRLHAPGPADLGALPRLLPDVSRPRRVGPLPGHRVDPIGLLDHPAYAHDPRDDRRAARARDRGTRCPRAVRAARAHRPPHPAHLALRVGDRGGDLPDAVRRALGDLHARRPLPGPPGPVLEFRAAREMPRRRDSRMAHAATLSEVERFENQLTPGWGKLMMWIFLCSDAMSFAGLLAAYGAVRLGSSDWPNPAQILDVPLTAINTFILICSSVTMVKALSAIKHGNKSGMLLWLAGTILGGATFL